MRNNTTTNANDMNQRANSNRTIWIILGLAIAALIAYGLYANTEYSDASNTDSSTVVGSTPADDDTGVTTDTDTNP